MNKRATYNTHEWTQAETDQIKVIQESFKTKWKGKVSKEVVEDIAEVFYDKESLKTNGEIFEETLDDYRYEGVQKITPEYNKRFAWKSFLKRFTNHPYYRELIQLPDGISKFCDFLGNIFEKMQQGGQGEGEKEFDPESATFQRIIDYGKSLLELFEDPAIQEMLIPQEQPQPGGKKAGKGQKDMMGELMKMDFDKIKVLDLCVKVGLVMRFHRKGKENWSRYPDDGIDIRNIESFHEVQQITPGNMALPSDIFYQRLAKKELQVKGFTTKKEHKQVLYMLIDSSGSMNSSVGKSNLKAFQMACAVAIAYLRKMTIHGDMTAVRFFDTGTTELMTAFNTKEAGQLIKKILEGNFNGGGTDIPQAIYTAIRDISQQESTDKRIKDADILIISDGEDEINVNEVKEKLGKTKLHTAILGGSNSGLKQCSETYMEAEQEEDVWKMAEILNQE